MQVKMKMDDVSITLGNKGVLLKLSDNSGKHVGDLRIGKATVEWMKGRASGTFTPTRKVVRDIMSTSADIRGEDARDKVDAGTLPLVLWVDSRDDGAHRTLRAATSQWAVRRF